MARILGDLSLRLSVDSGHCLEEDLVYHVGGAASDTVIEVPAGFRTAWTSLPWAVRWLLSGWRAAARAVIIHEYLYSAEGRQRHGFTRAQADAVLREALQVTGARLWLIVWLAVRLLASPQWRRSDRGGWRRQP